MCLLRDDSDENTQSAIDFERLIGLFPESPELVQSLIGDYIRQSDGFVAALDGAIRNGASLEVRNIAHEWRGASATCGVDVLVEPLEKLERLGAAADLTDARPIFDRVADSWWEARKALEAGVAREVAPAHSGNTNRNSMGPAINTPDLSGDTGSLVESHFRGQREQLIKATERWVGSGCAVSADSLRELREIVRELAETSRDARKERCARLATALENLFVALAEQPRKATSSCARTIRQALELAPHLEAEIQSGAFGPGFFPQILVVDDSNLSRRVLLAALEAVQLKAESLGNAVEALEVMQSSRLDLVFLDINMPEMSGIELCQKMQTFEPNAQTPVVFVSGFRDPDTILDSIGSGAVDFITKPVLLQEISLKALIYLLRPRFG